MTTNKQSGSGITGRPPHRQTSVSSFSSSFSFRSSFHSPLSSPAGRRPVRRSEERRLLLFRSPKYWAHSASAPGTWNASHWASVRSLSPSRPVVPLLSSSSSASPVSPPVTQSLTCQAQAAETGTTHSRSQTPFSRIQIPLHDDPFDLRHDSVITARDRRCRHQGDC